MEHVRSQLKINFKKRNFNIKIYTKDYKTTFLPQSADLITTNKLIVRYNKDIHIRRPKRFTVINIDQIIFICFNLNE